MKTNNIFDHMDNEPAVLDEQTVIEETGVSTDNVKELFREMVKNGGAKKSKKKNITKVFTVLAAAVAATLIVGTVTAGATGSFNSTFGEIFAGEADNGMYSGGNVNVNSDIVSVDFKGIAGDKETVYGLMELTKKDGSNFFDGDKKDYFIMYDYESEERDATVTCTRSLADTISSKIFYHPYSGTGAIDFDIIDNSKLSAVFQYNDSEFNIVGETLSFKEDHILLYHIDKVLCTRDEFYKTMDAHQDENDPFWTDGLSLVEKISKKYDNPIAENQIIECDINGNISLMTKTQIDLHLDGSVKLNYKDTTRYFSEAEGIKTTYSGSEVIVKSLEVRPLSLRLEVAYPTNNVDEYMVIMEKEPYDAVNSVTITLKNGKSYTMDNCPLFLSDNVHRLSYSFYEGFTPFVINPKEVKSIVYNGTILYQE